MVARVLARYKKCMKRKLSYRCKKLDINFIMKSIKCCLYKKWYIIIESIATTYSLNKWNIILKDVSTILKNRLKNSTIESWFVFENRKFYFFRGSQRNMNSQCSWKLVYLKKKSQYFSFFESLILWQKS